MAYVLEAAEQHRLTSYFDSIGAIPGRHDPRESFALYAMGLLLVAVLPTCHLGLKLSAKEIDDLHRNCQEMIVNGSFSTRGSKDIGFLPEARPPGTPVIVYGASWCAACDAAASYLTRRGIPFVEKDVEEDAVAKASRDTMLAAAGLARTNSLPVIDVRGTVTVGFFPCVVDSAWAAP